MRKIWILSALIMLLVTLYQINSTYAKYFTQANGIVEETIGAWIVKVNDTNIATESTVENFTINALKYNSNDYVLEGKIAPGLLGYFDITIDATEASVAVRYDVTIDFIASTSPDESCLTFNVVFPSSLELTFFNVNVTPAILEISEVTTFEVDVILVPLIVN